jgi:hypothetical protein
MHPRAMEVARARRLEDELGDQPSPLLASEAV